MRSQLHPVRAASPRPVKRDERSSGDERPASFRRLTEGVVPVCASGAKTRSETGQAPQMLREGEMACAAGAAPPRRWRDASRMLVPLRSQVTRERVLRHLLTVRTYHAPLLHSATVPQNATAAPADCGAVGRLVVLETWQVVTEAWIGSFGHSVFGSGNWAPSAEEYVA